MNSNSNNMDYQKMVELIKNINTLEEVIILEKNKNYIINTSNTFRIIEQQGLCDKKALDETINFLINDYNVKYKTDHRYKESDTYYDVFNRIIYGIDLRLNQILSDEIQKYIIKAVRNNG